MNCFTVAATGKPGRRFHAISLAMPRPLSRAKVIGLAEVATMGNLIIRTASILLVSSWPIMAGLTGFVITAISDSVGNHWALVVTVCVMMVALTIALLVDLAVANEAA